MDQLIYETKLRQAAVLRAVEAENDRQIGKFGVQDHPLWRWFLVLMEEVGEAVDAYLADATAIPPEEYIVLHGMFHLGQKAQSVLEGDLPDRINAVRHAPDLGKEIIQVAAVAVALEENRRWREMAA